ncbi:hypothetical protein ACFL5V_04470 [Fibrobacterota bacterium]
MDQKFLYLYKQLIGKSANEMAHPGVMRPVSGFLAGLMDNSHTVVLHALLEELESEGGGRHGQISIQPALNSLKALQLESENLEIDIRRRLNEFSINWSSRFAEGGLLPYLKSDGWVLEEDNAYRLRGKGSKAESRKLYQQSLQDMVTEGVRILALFLGTLSRLQEKLAGEWHRETVRGNVSKLLPLFEAALRPREMELFKDIRSTLPERFAGLFIARVNKWQTRLYSTEEDLYQNIAWPWYDCLKQDNGFEGFMLFVEEFIWELIKLITGLFQNKWRIFLRGLERKAEHEFIVPVRVPS